MPQSQPSRPRRLHARTVMLLAVGLGLAFLLRMASSGLPQTWINTLSEWVSTPRFACELERVSVSFRRGELDIGRIQVYPRGAVSDPVLELRDTSVRLRPKRGKHALTWIRTIRVRRAVIPGSVLARPTGRSASAGQSDPGRPAAEPTQAAVAEPATLTTIPDWGPLRLTCHQLSFSDVTAGRLSATLTCRDGHLTLDPVSVHLKEPRAKADSLTGRLAMTFSPFTLTGSASGPLDTGRVVPIFEAFRLTGVANEIRRFSFPEEPPHVDFKLNYDPANQQRELALTFEADYCQYNDVSLNGMNGTLTVSGTDTWNRVRIDPLRTERPEGQAEGFIDIDTDASLLHFSAVSTLDPLHLLRIIRIVNRPLTLPLGFDNPTHVKASGRVDLRRAPTRTDVAATIQAARIISYGIDFEQAVAHAVITDDAWRLTRATATVYGGRFQGGAVFTPSPTNRADVMMTSSGRLKDLQHAGWGALMGDASPQSTGTLDLDYSLSGPILENGDAFVRALSGTATVNMKEVELYRVPLFAGFTKIIAENIPGVDFVLSQDALSTSVALTNGVFTLPDLRIIGNVFSASGGGTLDVGGGVNLRLKVHLLNRETWVGKSLYYVLFPLSKIFELQATGTIRDPRWSSATLSK